ncbi:MAG TPA: DUF4282 domain-containing protein [Candidatus Angelobacter sp.]
MAFCGKCGSQLHENATFCASCGTPVSAVTTPTQPAGGTPATPHPFVPQAQPYVPQQMYAPPPPPPPRDSMGSLFDVTFKNEARMPVVKVLFVVSIVLAAAIAIFLIYLSQEGTPPQIDPKTFILIFAPTFFFLYVLQARLILEVCTAAFRMEKYLAEIAQQGKR